METAVPWIVFAVSLLGLLFAALAPTLVLPDASPASETDACAREMPPWRDLLLGAGGIAAVLFAATLPTRPPWSVGQGMGGGFALGAIAALLGGALIARIPRRGLGASEQAAGGAHLISAAGMGVGMLSLGTMAVALTVILFPHSAPDALNGTALGVLLVAMLLRLGLGLRAAHAGGEHRPDGVLFEGWAACVLTLAVATAFGFYRYPVAVAGARMGPLAIAAVGILALMAGTGLFFGGGRPGRVLASIGLFAATAVAALSALALPRLVPDPGAVTVTLLGIGTALLVALLASLSPQRSPGKELPPLALEVGVLPALMAVGLFVTCFQWLRGYGFGSALVGAWAVGGAALVGLCWRDLQGPRAEDPATTALSTAAVALHRFLGVGALFLLFRLFLERYRPLSTDLSLTMHFTLVGLAFGAVAPLLLGSGIARAARVAAETERGARLAFHAGLGLWLWIAALPAAAGVAWGMRALVGVLGGLIIAGLYGLVLDAITPRRTPAGLAVGVTLLALLGMALGMVQAAHLLGPLGILHRGVRVGVLAGTMALGVAWMVVGAWLHGGETAGSTEGEPR